MDASPLPQTATEEEAVVAVRVRWEDQNGQEEDNADAVVVVGSFSEGGNGLRIAGDAGLRDAFRGVPKPARGVHKRQGRIISDKSDGDEEVAAALVVVALRVSGDVPLEGLIVPLAEHSLRPVLERLLREDGGKGDRGSVGVRTLSAPFTLVTAAGLPEDDDPGPSPIGPPPGVLPLPGVDDENPPAIMTATTLESEDLSYLMPRIVPVHEPLLTEPAEQLPLPPLPEEDAPPPLPRDTPEVELDMSRADLAQVEQTDDSLDGGFAQMREELFATMRAEMQAELSPAALVAAIAEKRASESASVTS
jgi:hypothetical protein